MPSLEAGIYQLGRLDELARGGTAVHRLDPRTKLLTTLFFLIAVLSFGRYEILPLLPFALYPVVLIGSGRLPFGFLFRRVLIAAPFALLVGMFNPFLDRTIVHFAGLGLAAGWLSFASILIRFGLTTLTALALIGTTGMNGICDGLEHLGLPDVLATQLLFLYRYIFVLAGEVMRMARAWALRSFGRRGMSWRVYSGMLGSLLLRTFGRAQRVYLAMLARGFDGSVRVGRELSFRPADLVFLGSWSAAFLLFRLVDVPLFLGRAATALLS